jgi:hypothetical protein
MSFVQDAHKRRWPWMALCREGQESENGYVQDVRAENCSCIFRTSAILGGRMPRAHGRRPMPAIIVGCAGAALCMPRCNNNSVNF